MRMADNCLTALRYLRTIDCMNLTEHPQLPSDILAELEHALTRAQPPQGVKRFAVLMRTRPILHPYLPLLPRAFAISSTMRVGVYDCVYVALAERESCELITADQKMVNALQKDFPFI